MDEPTELSLHRYDVSERRGFLPDEDPLVAFQTDSHPPAVRSYLAALDDLAERLPTVLDAEECRTAVDGLEQPPPDLLEELTARERYRLCLVSGFLASGYIHQLGSPSVDRLPASVAVPLYQSSMALGRKPILSYDMIALHNFRRLDPDRGFSLDNLDTVLDFTAHPDETWFVIVHVAIEAAAGPALIAAADAQQAIDTDEPGAVAEQVERITDSLTRQTELMSRMTEGNDPEVFATGFRPYYDGFDSVVYEGVDELDGEPQEFRGGSGAQSCVLPSLDAALGIEHAATALIEKLLDMRSYMPERHRAVIDTLDTGPDIRSYVAQRGDPALTASFNSCLDQLREFRRVHFGQVIQYIRAQTGETTGTGGTDYMEFLTKLEEETDDHKV